MRFNNIDAAAWGFDSITSRMIRTLRLSGPAANLLATPNPRDQTMD
jgi:hypothetical protein